MPTQLLGKGKQIIVSVSVLVTTICPCFAIHLLFGYKDVLKFVAIFVKVVVKILVYKPHDLLLFISM